MRQSTDTKTAEMFPPEVRVYAPVPKGEYFARRQAEKEAREAKAAAKWEARRWVIVVNPGTEDEDRDGPRFSTHAEALRSGSTWGVKFDVMFRDVDGNLTTEF